MRWVSFGLGFLAAAVITLLADRRHTADGHVHCAACGARLDRPAAPVLRLVPENGTVG
jgi:hypothetical protein